MDPVIPNVAHSAQDDAQRKALRALGIEGAKLPQRRNQRVPHQRVDLVDQQHHRTGVGGGPAHEELRERAVGLRNRDQGLRDLGRRRASGDAVRFERDHLEYGTHGGAHILAGRLSGLHVCVQAPVLAPGAAVQQVAQRQQRRRLAGLPGRVEHDVSPAADELQHFVEIKPVERGNAVVPSSMHRSGGVEVAHVRQAGDARHQRTSKRKPVIGHAASAASPSARHADGGRCTDPAVPAMPPVPELAGMSLIPTRHPRNVGGVGGVRCRIHLRPASARRSLSARRCP